MSAAIGHLRNYVAGVVENGETDMALFDRFVVRPESSASRRIERQRRMDERLNGNTFNAYESVPGIIPYKFTE